MDSLGFGSSARLRSFIDSVIMLPCPACKKSLSGQLGQKSTDAGTTQEEGQQEVEGMMKSCG